MSHKSVAEKFQDDVYNISILGRHVMVTDAMQQYAIEKIQKIERFSSRVIDVDIVMDIQKLDHRVDITMKLEQLMVRSTATSDSIYTSMDRAVDKLKAQVRRYKGRIHEHQVRGGASENINVKILDAREDEVLNEVNDEILSENTADLIQKYTPHRIVSEETRPLKTLNYNEAVMKMELSGDAFIVFRAEEDQKLKVIYRRKDNNYGIIEPEK
ncbi:MAG: ribosome-associated translation inhibitor RaiA [Parachlamydiaceae bacterium]|nr:ribosome-associated translation inhibitor RaiA [Parachlamydiaceae bacterium]